MKHVKVSLIDPSVYAKRMNDEVLLADDFECEKLLVEATRHYAELQSGLSSPRIVRRKYRALPVPHIFVIGGSTSRPIRCKYTELNFSYIF